MNWRREWERGGGTCKCVAVVFVDTIRKQMEGGEGDKGTSCGSDGVDWEEEDEGWGFLWEGGAEVRQESKFPQTHTWTQHAHNTHTHTHGCRRLPRRGRA